MPPAPPVTVLLPVFNDWEAAAEVVRRLDAAVASAARLDLLVVDDGSDQEPPADFLHSGLVRVGGAELLRLRRNLGHQRAIAVGLAYLYATARGHTVVVMDADGEDPPEEVDSLLRGAAASGHREVVFARRTRRFEPFWFRVLYRCYRTAHRVLTGLPVRIGNFSVVPPPALAAVVAVSDLWSHYAAAVVKARIPHRLVPCPRGRRIAGERRMSLIALVTHGLGAISVFGEVVGARLLIAALVGVAVTVVGLAALVALRLFTALVPPGWAVAAGLLLLLLLLQVLTIAGAALFLVLYARNRYDFVPLRDCPLFIASVERLREAPPSG